MRVMRVFPRRTAATPRDETVRVGCPPGLFDEADEVRISVTFTWDMPAAERLERQWRHVAPVRVGGPATGARGEEFTPGLYVRDGYVITSRGCPNRCWFCSVWKREGQTVRELPIRDGVNVLDDNLLAASRPHIEAVFAMLARQKTAPLPAGESRRKRRKRRPTIQFTGGLEAARLEWWHAKALHELRPSQVFFAYDTPDDLTPLRRAGEMLREAGFTRAGHRLRAYVLVGAPKDTLEAAERRISETLAAGFLPMAMLYRDRAGAVDPEWRTWARRHARPAILCARKAA